MEHSEQQKREEMMMMLLLTKPDDREQQMIEQQLCFVDFVGNPRSKLSDNTCFANFLEPWTDQQIDIGHLPLSCGVQSSCSLIDIVCLFVVESFFLAANKKNKIACLLYVSLLHLRSLALKASTHIFFFMFFFFVFFFNGRLSDYSIIGKETEAVGTGAFDGRERRLRRFPY
jgi:hypothetical protein